MVSLCITGDNADTFAPFSPTALIDSAQAESEAVAVMADGFDPAGLYATERLRDLALSLLADSLPALNVSLSLTDNRHRVAGKWIVSREWLAMAFLQDGRHVAATADNPGDAVEKVIKAHARATAPVRTRPEARGIAAESFEALGRINPADAPAFTDALARDYASDSLTVQPDGRITLTRGAVDDIEALALGQIVADFLHARTPGAVESERDVRIVVEQQGDTFKSWVVLPSGERIHGGRSFWKADARTLAERKVYALRPTVPFEIVITAINAV
jgi:hypothetical protein